MRKRSNKMTNAIIVICVLMYILMQVCMMIFSAREEPIVLGAYVIPAQSLCGVFANFQFLTCIILVVLAGERGFKTAICILCINITWMILVIGIKRLGSAIPSIPIVLISLGNVLLLHYGMKRIRENERRLDEMAHTDSLTNLPNRRAFNQKLQSYIKQDEKFAVAFIDIDNFKNINDTMGHDYGNHVLIEIARRWNSILGEKHFLARLGGDEFALIISGYKESADVKTLVERYQYTLKEKFLINNKDFYITASIGVSFYPDNSKDSSILLRYADTAMYNAKSEGKHQICLFTHIVRNQEKYLYGSTEG